jgi:hypothetical protein
VDSVRSAVTPSRWAPARWAAAIVLGIAAAGVAYTVSQDAARPPSTEVLPGRSGVTAAPQQAPAPTLAEAVAQFEAIFDALLIEERAAALESADDPGQRGRREQRLRELRARAGKLEQLIENFANTPSFRSPKTNAPEYTQ